MFRKNKAAQYFVVAWIRDWRLRTYLDAIGGGQKIPFERAHRYYRWLPISQGAYFYNVPIRRLAYETMRDINDRLWDAGTDAERLKLSAQIAKWNCGLGEMRGSDARKEERKAHNKYRAAGLSAAQQRLLWDRAGGHHWNVCK